MDSFMIRQISYGVPALISCSSKGIGHCCHDRSDICLRISNRAIRHGSLGTLMSCQGVSDFAENELLVARSIRPMALPLELSFNDKGVGVFDPDLIGTKTCGTLNISLPFTSRGNVVCAFESPRQGGGSRLLASNKCSG